MMEMCDNLAVEWGATNTPTRHNQSSRWRAFMASDKLQRKRADSQQKKDEIWLPVPSLPGVFASSKGRLVGPPRIAPMSNGGFRHYITQPTFGTQRTSKRGASHVYMGTMMRPYGIDKQINVKVHRAVCEAFHGPQTDKNQVVIHIDEDATNNVPENLKWGTMKENMNMPKIKAFHRSRTEHLEGMRARLVSAKEAAE